MAWRLRDWLIELLALVRAQKLRSALTVLAITWGTLSVILLLAFGFGFAEHMQSETESIGRGVAIAWPQRTSLPYAGFGPGRRIALTRSDVERLRAEVPGLAGLSSEFTNLVRVRRGTSVLQVVMSGVEPDYAELRSMRPRPGGRFVGAQDVAARRRVVFLGDWVARRLFGVDEPVGERVIISGAPFLVIGVLQPKDQSSDYVGRDADMACLPATTFSDVVGRRFVDNFVYRAADPARQDELTGRVFAALGRRHGFDPVDPEALNLWDTTEEQRMVSFIFLGFNLILAVSGTFTLLVGGVGVANLMYVLVRRRTAEIGLQMAVGARPRQVLVDVLGQTLVLVGAGGLLGYLLSAVVIVAVRLTPVVESVGEPRISPLLGGGVALLLILVALVAGFFPARRASRIDPVVALSR